MNTLRNTLKEKYSKIPNELIVDMSISHGALRVILYLFTKPSNWNVYNKDICKNLKISEKTLTKYWKELLESKWLEREKKLNNDGHFTGGYIYRIGNFSSSEKSSEQVKSSEHSNKYNSNNKEVYISNKSTKNKTSFPTEDNELKKYAILKAVGNGVKCPIQTYEAFKDHHIANGSKFKNWNSAFNTWIRNFFKYESPNKVEIVNTQLSDGSPISGSYDFNEELFINTATRQSYKVAKENYLEAVLSNRVTLTKL